MTSTPRPRPITVAVASAAAALSLALTGCATVNEYAFHEKELSFASYSDAPQRGDLAFVPAAFIPADATGLVIKTQTNGTGKIVMFESDTPLDPSVCQVANIGGDVPLDASWWPEKVPTTGVMCEPDWNAFELDGVTYGWRR